MHAVHKLVSAMERLFFLAQVFHEPSGQAWRSTEGIQDFKFGQGARLHVHRSIHDNKAFWHYDWTYGLHLVQMIVYNDSIEHVEHKCGYLNNRK